MKKIFFTAIIATLAISCSKKENSAIQSSESADVSTPVVAPSTSASNSPGELMNQEGCVACHNPEEKTVGPSYKQIAAKYENTPENVELLANKIISGGSGIWGDIPMPAHPTLGKEKAKILATYLLSQK